MSKIKPQDHPDYVGGWVWTNLELDWINERIGTLEAALFQAQEAAKDLETRLTKTEGWFNEAMWNYGELKREQLANQEKTSSSPVEDWEAVAADQAMTIALLKSEAAAQPAPVQQSRSDVEPVAWIVYAKGSRKYFTLTFDPNKVPEIYIGGEAVPLYTTPPAAQRQWVGLTDEEMYLNCPNWLSQEQCKVWIQQIEAKLKEKNT